MAVRKIITLILIHTFIFFLSNFAAEAQFYSVGNNPASTKWYYIESPDYKVIYTKGTDSLALSYIRKLEKYRPVVGNSVNFMPGEMMAVRIPVVLHPFNAASNGSVAWAPKRMDLYTSPPGYYPEPMTWSDMLAIHESRHVAQMQFGLAHVFRPFKYIFGEMFTGLLCGIFPDKWLLEGDAVVAETGLSSSGRGRTADFLNYYRIAFDNGDTRNFNKWKYGSYRYYTPDHYALGYMLLSGIRYKYDFTNVSGHMFRSYAKRPYVIFTQQKLIKPFTGVNIHQAADSVITLYTDLWKKDIASRAPFLPYEESGQMEGNYTEYFGNLTIEDRLYSLKESFVKSRRLVEIAIADDGQPGEPQKESSDESRKELSRGAFGNITGRIRYSKPLNLIIFSETVPDVRWSMKKNSLIRSADPKTGKKRNITTKGRIFNPCPFLDDERIAAVEYSDDGRSHLVIINGLSRQTVASVNLPDSLQIVEPAVLENMVYASCISHGGYGIYSLNLGGVKESRNDAELENHEKEEIQGHTERSEWVEILAPSPVMIKDLDVYHDSLTFVSDRTGSNELYMMDPDKGKIYRKTSTRYGAGSFTFSDDGKFLFCSLEGISGKNLVKIDTDSLLSEEVNFFDRYKYVIADKLTAQEKNLSSEDTTVLMHTTMEQLNISSPKRYRKFPNSFNLHSWAPFYMNLDNISNLSLDSFYRFLSLGASGFFQDRLGILSGAIGYSAHRDFYDRSNWRHSGHINLTFSGLYPVIEAKLDFNDRAAQSSSIMENSVAGKPISYLLYREITDKPYLSGEISAYIPFDFSSGGWSIGLIPNVSYKISNDRVITYLNGVIPGRNTLRQTLSATLRFYSIMDIAHSEVYPNLGIGLEGGISLNPGLTYIMSSSAYLYAYCYLPGFTGAQGWRLTALYRRRLLTKDTMILSEMVNLLPRGIKSSALPSAYTASYASAAKFTVEYAIPFWLRDFSIWKLFYCKRGIITPHFDLSLLGKNRLWSTGATLSIELGRFFGLSFPATIGISYSYNGGQEIDYQEKIGNKMRHSVTPVFSVSF